MGSHELTDTDFWDQYWKSIELPIQIDMGFSGDRCLANELLRQFEGVGLSGEVLEIGAAPGKWLAFMNDKFGMVASAIEYSPVGAEALQKNLDLLEVSVNKVHIGDFFEMTPEPRFDAVMSFGFIEHFDDPFPVVSRHLEWLRSGGKLIIGIPNFSNFHGKIQKVLDMGVYEAHNISIMDEVELALLVDVEVANVESVTHLGSFEPSLPYWTRSEVSWKIRMQVLVARSVLIGLRVLRLPKFVDRLNHPRISSYLLLVAVKK